MRTVASGFCVLSAAFCLVGCQSTLDRASTAWYDNAEVVCRNAQCQACRGSSSVGCTPCAASGKVLCKSCGNGMQQCGGCNGTGVKKQKQCKECNGAGQKKCSSCGGTMRVACGHCSGKARLMCLRTLHIPEKLPTGEDVWPRGQK